MILDENDDNTGEVSEIIRSVKQVLARQAKSRLNEIPDEVVIKPQGMFNALQAGKTCSRRHFAAEDILKLFSYFSQKIGFQMPCKLFLEKTCMK